MQKFSGFENNALSVPGGVFRRSHRLCLKVGRGTLKEERKGEEEWDKNSPDRFSSNLLGE